jgi:hypothetical protein
MDFSCAACGLARGRYAASGTLTQTPQILEREYARVVAVAPDDLIAVIADRLDPYRFKRLQLTWLEEAKRVGRLQAFLAATGARTVVAQMLPGVHAAVAVTPLDN